MQSGAGAEYKRVHLFVTDYPRVVTISSWTRVSSALGLITDLTQYHHNHDLKSPLKNPTRT